VERNAIQGGELAKIDSKVDRRGFLTGATATLASFIAGALAIPTIGHILSPALKPEEKPSISAGSIDQFEIGKPKKVEFVYYQKDGWIEEPTSGSAWVVRTSETQFTVFDPRCTHLGCPYGFNSELGQFFCPCHDGVFALDGQVVAGPPPRPLDQFKWAVADGKLFITEEIKKEEISHA
jgi:menaquinol-cytochrome c reductase iron-sulfur subunit